MKQDVIKHEHAKSSWLTVRIRVNEEIKKVLVVETDLPLNDRDEGFDRKRFDSLLEAITKYLSANKDVDSADVTRILPKA